LTRSLSRRVATLEGMTRMNRDTVNQDRPEHLERLFREVAEADAELLAALSPDESKALVEAREFVKRKETEAFERSGRRYCVEWHWGPAPERLDFVMEGSKREQVFREHLAPEELRALIEAREEVTRLEGLGRSRKKEADRCAGLKPH